MPESNIDPKKFYVRVYLFFIGCLFLKGKLGYIFFSTATIFRKRAYINYDFLEIREENTVEKKNIFNHRNSWINDSACWLY